jgi:valyl-tRNA synthetase
MENYDAKVSEQKWRKQWEKWRIYRYDATRPRPETFIVDTPPPTVSGSLHIGHVFSYTHQDLIVRYRRMRGFNIYYPMGWDDNGLPTERRVENFFHVRCDPSLPYEVGLEIKPNTDVPRRKVSRRNFIELCQLLTTKDEEAYKDLWQRLGLSVDWSLEYSTISDSARRISQYSFLRLVKKGEVYRASAPVVWDTTFRTTIAQAEIEERECSGNFYRLRFPLKEGGECIVATTRPELLGACCALIVHPKDARYSSHIGKTVITPLFYAPVPVLSDERVVQDKGTGVVMICTFGDSTDVEWWKKFSLPLKQIITPSGHMANVEFGTGVWTSEQPGLANESIKQLAGLQIEKARQKIVQLLNENGFLVEQAEPVKHAVKFYEKGDRPLEILPTKQWFIRLLNKKEVLLKQGEKIKWHPSFMFERYRSWVEGLNQDWCISRQRYFGVPFPVWYRCDEMGQPVCDCPLYPSLDQLPVDPMIDVPTGFDASQRNTPNGFAAESDVLDTWATSSLTPQLSSGWIFSPDKHEALFPTDVRPQAHEIIRTWAFYTITMAWLHEEQVPWHHVLISGWILDPDRKKMSKSKGNTVTPLGLLETYSSDAVRYWAAKARAGADTAYDETVFKVGRRLATKLFNAGRFISGCLEGTDTGEDPDNASLSCEVDLGLISQLRKCVEQSTSSFDNFEWANALTIIESFFWNDLCDNYLEIVKERIYQKEMSAGKMSALITLRLTFRTILRLFAPFMPYICEELWSANFATEEGREKSVHTSPWPTLAEYEKIGLPGDSTSFAIAVHVLGEIRKVKAEAKKSVKWPVSKVHVACPTMPSQAVINAINELRAAGAINELSIGIGEGDKISVDVTLADQILHTSQTMQ